MSQDAALDALAAARAELDQVLAADRDVAVRVAAYVDALAAEGVAGDVAVGLAICFQQHLLSAPEE